MGDNEPQDRPFPTPPFRVEGTRFSDPDRGHALGDLGGQGAHPTGRLRARQRRQWPEDPIPSGIRSMKGRTQRILVTSPGTPDAQPGNREPGHAEGFTDTAPAAGLERYRVASSRPTHQQNLLWKGLPAQ
jgi:hypothetical protein